MRGVGHIIAFNGRSRNGRQKPAFSRCAEAAWATIGRFCLALLAQICSRRFAPYVQIMGKGTGSCGRTPLAFDLEDARAMIAPPRKPAPKSWTEERVRRELRAFLDRRREEAVARNDELNRVTEEDKDLLEFLGFEDWGNKQLSRQALSAWPKTQDFQRAGLAPLLAAIQALGGSARWRREMGAVQVTPYKDREDLRSDLEWVLARRRRFPRRDELGRDWPALVRGIERHGGAAHWAAQLGLPMPENSGWSTPAGSGQKHPRSGASSDQVSPTRLMRTVSAERGKNPARHMRTAAPAPEPASEAEFAA
jgi:hypothetical protein